MKIPFSKYHGTGNDFVIIDNRLLQLSLSVETIAQLCHRRFGIGADGLMFLNKSDKYVFEMQYHNSDGKIGSMCGNGGRCIVAFAKQLQLFAKHVEFIAFDGVHNAEVLEAKANNTMVKLAMQDVDHIEQIDNAYVLNTGSPHYVTFVQNVENINVYEEGNKIRYSKPFAEKGGLNVNFVEVNKDSIYVRTYERGVEDETYSCGTGVVASAIAFSKKENINNVAIKTKGGNLNVSFEYINNVYKNIYLQGYATHLFDGIIEVD